MNEYMGDFIFDTFQPFYFHRTDDVGYYIPTANQEQAPTTGLPDKEIALGKENDKSGAILIGSSRVPLSSICTSGRVFFFLSHHSRSIAT